MTTLSVIALVGCGEDGNPHVDELPPPGQLAAGELSSQEFAEAARMLGEGRVSDDIRRAAAEGLGAYLEDIGDAAEAESRGPFDRRVVVAFAAEVGRDGQAAIEVADALKVWARERFQPLVIDPHYTIGDIELELTPAAMVIAAFMDGFDTIDDPPYNSSEFLGMIIEPLHYEVAAAIARDRGRELPEDASNAEVDRLYQDETDYGGNPVRQLDREVSYQRGQDGAENIPWTLP